jgi:hypothetical protein
VDHKFEASLVCIVTLSLQNPKYINKQANKESGEQSTGIDTHGNR